MSNTPNTRRDSMMNSINEIDIHQLISEIISNKWIIAIVVGVFFVLGAIYAIHKKPQYQTSALIQMNKEGNSMSDLSSLASLMSDVSNQQAQASPASIESTLIQSRYVLGPVIDKLGLDISAKQYHWPILGMFASKTPNAITIKKLSVPTSWVDQDLTIIKNSNTAYTVYDPNGNKIASGSFGQNITSKAYPSFTINVTNLKGSAGTEFIAKKQRLENAMFALTQGLNINTANPTRSSNVDTGIMELTLTGQSADSVVTTLNAILETAYNLGIQQQSMEAEKVIQFLSKQIPEVKAQLTKAEDALSAYQTKSGNLGVSAQGQVLLQEIVSVNQQLEQLKLQKTELLQRYTPSHPFVITLNNKIKVVQNELNGLEKRVKDLPESDKTAVSLMREVKTKDQLYLLLLSKLQQMQVLKAGVISNMKILDTAYVPAKVLPVHRLTILIVSIILGFLFSVTGIVIKMLFRTGIMDPDIIEQNFGVPVAGIIPHSKNQVKISDIIKGGVDNKSHILAQDNPADISMEAIRSLRTSLQIAMSGDQSQSHVICISGLTPGIGKSFISLNLAYAMAQTGTEVLLIDADVRKGKIHKSFHIPASPGITDFLSGDTSLDHAKIYELQKMKNLHFIPRGKIVKNPAEMLQDKSVSEMIESLKAEYPVIIIDTPPLLAVSDPISIMKLSDINLLLLSAGQHTQRELSQAFSLLNVNNIKVNSCIFNFANIKSSSSYYYYTGYSYKNYEAYAN